MPVTLHPSIRCWCRKWDDSNDLEMLTKEYVRCKEGCQAGKEWRRDYVWVQDTQTDGSLLGGKRVGQLQAIVTVIDHQRHNTNGTPVQYTEALINLLRLRYGGKVGGVHGMVEVEDWPQVRTQNPRDIGHWCFFNMSTILRSPHMIPSGKAGVNYINNYVD